LSGDTRRKQAIWFQTLNVQMCNLKDKKLSPNQTTSANICPQKRKDEIQISKM